MAMHSAVCLHDQPVPPVSQACVTITVGVWVQRITVLWSLKPCWTLPRCLPTDSMDAANHAFNPQFSTLKFWHESHPADACIWHLDCCPSPDADSC